MIRVFAALWFAVLGFLAPATAQDAAYRLGTNDIITIRVFEWLAIEGLVREWPSITGEYTVGQDGTISLPFLGRYAVADRTTEEVAEDVGIQLKLLLALQDRPTASVQIARYRPIYINGYVEAPGLYEFEPGLTVRKVVATAGGLERGPEGDLGLSRSVISSRGQIRLLGDQFDRLAVRLARIEAELAGSDAIETFLAIDKTPAVDVLVADEQAILTSRNRQVAREITAQERRKEILTSEISSFEQKLVDNERQLDLARVDLEKTKDLAGRGLARQADVFDRERFLVDIQGEVLDIQLSLLNARLNLEAAEQQIATITDNRASELALERQRLDAELKALALREATEAQLLAESLQLSADQAADLTDLDALVISYAIIRTVDGTEQEVAASLDSPILPGDVVEVRATPPTTQ